MISGFHSQRANNEENMTMSWHHHVLTFVRGIHRWLVDSPHKGPVMQKAFPCLTSSCTLPISPRHFSLNVVFHLMTLDNSQVSQISVYNYILVCWNFDKHRGFMIKVTVGVLRSMPWSPYFNPCMRENLDKVARHRNNTVGCFEWSHLFNKSFTA